jgi:hypothetical protein
MSYIVEALFKWENYTSENNALPHLQRHSKDIGYYLLLVNLKTNNNGRVISDFEG